MYDDLNNVQNWDKNAALPVIVRVLKAMRPTTRGIMAAFLQIMQETLAQKTTNKMSPNALGIVFGPNMLGSSETQSNEELMRNGRKTGVFYFLCLFHLILF